MKTIEIEIYSTSEKQKHLLGKVNVTSLIEEAVKDKLDTAILMNKNALSIKQVFKYAHDEMIASLKNSRGET